MIKSQNRGKINPAWASMKGRRPKCNSIGNSRNYRRKVFYINGKKAGKMVSKKIRKWSRETIRKGDCHIKHSQWNDKKSMVMDTYWLGFDLFGLGEAFPPAQWAINGSSAVIKNYLTTRKQPRARAGFRRGQRRIKR